MYIYCKALELWRNRFFSLLYLVGSLFACYKFTSNILWLFWYDWSKILSRSIEVTYVSIFWALQHEISAKMTNWQFSGSQRTLLVWEWITLFSFRWRHLKNCLLFDGYPIYRVNNPVHIHTLKNKRVNQYLKGPRSDSVFKVLHLPYYPAGANSLKC